VERSFRGGLFAKLGYSYGTSKNTVPEPGTFILLGSGLLGSGMLKYYPAALRRRLLNRRK